MSSDAYYGAGSDDFRGYVWRIPETQVLLEQRREVDAGEWLLEEGETVGTLRECRYLVAEPHHRSLAFAKSAGGTRYLPASLSRPLFRLNG